MSPLNVAIRPRGEASFRGRQSQLSLNGIMFVPSCRLVCVCVCAFVYMSMCVAPSHQREECISERWAHGRTSERCCRGSNNVLWCMALCFLPSRQDTVSERLRRWTRNPLGSARRGSNPLGVALGCFRDSVRLRAQGVDCISRESNPGHIDGDDVFYH